MFAKIIIGLCAETLKPIRLIDPTPFPIREFFALLLISLLGCTLNQHLIDLSLKNFFTSFRKYEINRLGSITCVADWITK
jgi:hypothetical protein